MKYAKVQLARAYGDALNGVLPVFNGGFTANTALDSYIVIGEVLAVPIPQDSNFFTEYIVNIEVNTKSDSYSQSTNDGYVNQVLAIVNADTVLTGMADFEMDNQVIEDVQPIPTLGAAENEYRTLIRIRAYLTQK